MAWKITYLVISEPAQRAEISERFETEEAAQAHVTSLLMRHILSPMMQVQIEEE